MLGGVIGLAFSTLMCRRWRGHRAGSGPIAL